MSKHDVHSKQRLKPSFLPHLSPLAARESTKIEALRSSYQQSMEDLRKEKEMLERQLEYERVRLEAESRKASLESQEKVILLWITCASFSDKQWHCLPLLHFLCM